jgi:hypothetical protein
MNTWAIINSAENCIENFIVWDGDENKWTPPNGTYAVKIEDINYSTINEKPEDGQPLI